MNLYSYIFCFRGGTYISQVKADNVKMSLRLWPREVKASEIKHFGTEAKKQIVNQASSDTPSLLEGLSNVLYSDFKKFTGLFYFYYKVPFTIPPSTVIVCPVI